MAGVLSRLSFATAAEISLNNENNVKSTAFWLSVWKKWCLVVWCLALRARAILLVLKKNLLVLVYSKLYSKSCDYLY